MATKLIRITTVPISLEKLLERQLRFMSTHFEVVAVSAEKERLEAYGKQEYVRTQYMPLTRKITPFKDLKALWKLYCFLKQEKPDIVHTHTPKAGTVGMLAAKLAGVPYRLHTVAGLPLMESTGLKRKLLNAVEKLTYACATKVYPNSKGLHQFIVNEKLTKPSKLKMIGNGSSNGIDTNYFDPNIISEAQRFNLRKDLNITPADFVFVFVGRLVKDKGINELVAAFNTLQKTHSNIKLLLVGPFEHDLDPLEENTLKSISASPHIITTGYQQDVRPYFAISDALVFPSYREGFPNVVLQASAMGLPAIVTDINGCNEIISNNVNGIIVKKKDSQALWLAMKEMIENKKLYAKLKQNSRSLIQEKYERLIFWNLLLEEYRGLKNH